LVTDLRIYGFTPLPPSLAGHPVDAQLRIKLPPASRTQFPDPVTCVSSLARVAVHRARRSPGATQDPMVFYEIEKAFGIWRAPRPRNSRMMMWYGSHAITVKLSDAVRGPGTALLLGGRVCASPRLGPRGRRRCHGMRGASYVNVLVRALARERKPPEPGSRRVSSKRPPEATATATILLLA
jgi:hypothetical protein